MGAYKRKKGNAKECSNYRTTALTSHASKVMLKILQARLQQYVNRELPDVQAGFRKGGGTRDQIANICWIIEKAREFQKNIYFCFIEYTEASDCASQFSRSVVSNSLRPHASQHARPPCPSPTPRVHSNSRPLSRWCHPAISSSVVPCPFLTVASWPAYKFLKRQVSWSGIPISWRIFHSLLWSTQQLWHTQ